MMRGFVPWKENSSSLYDNPSLKEYFERRELESIFGET
jgi:hypothetical protein